MIQRGPRGGCTSRPMKAKRHWPETSKMQSSGVNSKVLPPRVTSRFERVDFLLQSMVYSLPITLVAPTLAARELTTSLGPANIEVPLSMIAFCGEEMTAEPP